MISIQCCTYQAEGGLGRQGQAVGLELFEKNTYWDVLEMEMYSMRAFKQGLQFLLQSRREATKIYPQTVGLLVAASLDLEAELSLPLPKAAVAVRYLPQDYIWGDAKLL